MEDIARRGGLSAIVLGLAATVLKVAGGGMALSLVRPWDRLVQRRWLLTVAGVAGALLVYYGMLQVAAGALGLSGAVHPLGVVDRGALSWHAALKDIWFLVWGCCSRLPPWSAGGRPSGDCGDPHNTGGSHRCRRPLMPVRRTPGLRQRGLRRLVTQQPLA